MGIPPQRGWRVGALVAAAAIALFLWARPTKRIEPAEDSRDSAPATQTRTPPQGPSAGVREHAGEGDRLATAPAARTGAAPTPLPPRAPPYRPAAYLYYSEERPSKSVTDDGRQPALGRILELTGADARQEAAIRSAWRAHEDGRRVLWASAFPRVSGPRLLDPERLEELDSAFETAVFDVLRPGQRERLSQELPPPGVPHTPPPRMYADPRLEK